MTEQIEALYDEYQRLGEQHRKEIEDKNHDIEALKDINLRYFKRTEEDEDTIKGLKQVLSDSQRDTEILQIKLQDYEREISALKLTVNNLQERSKTQDRESDGQIDELKAKNVQLESKNSLLRDMYEATKRELQDSKEMNGRNNDETVQFKKLKEELEEASVEIEYLKSESKIRSEELGANETQISYLRQCLEESGIEYRDMTELHNNEITKLQDTMTQIMNERNDFQNQVQILEDQLKYFGDVGQFGEAKVLKFENEKLRNELEKLEKENDMLAERIVTQNEDFDKIVAGKVFQERFKLSEVEKEISDFRTKSQIDSQSLDEMESQMSELQRQKAELQEWKSIYESGHGMQELARNHKIVKDANRRLTLVIENLSNRIESREEAFELLSKAFNKLKIEAGKDSTFMYPEYDLKVEMLSENSKLLGEKNQLQEFLENLEVENSKLRRVIQEQAGLLRDKGFDLGLTSEISDNLRNATMSLIEGSTAIENRKLKGEIRALKAKIDGYEFKGRDNNVDYEDMKSDLKNEILSQNKELKDQIAFLQGEIRGFLSNSNLNDKKFEELLRKMNKLTSAKNNNSSRPQFVSGYVEDNSLLRSSLKEPTTEAGRSLLKENLKHLNLPSAEWADEVRSMNCQLIECLEQLAQREEEVEEQNRVIGEYEESILSVKQQLIVLYNDHVRKSIIWSNREKEYKDELSKYRDEREDMMIRVKRLNELVDVQTKGDVEAMRSKLSETVRQLLVYEVNENILSRKFVSQSEQLNYERNLRLNLEKDFVEMEATLKRRMLSLELYKASSSEKCLLLQQKLDLHVPQGDYLTLEQEVEYLRGEQVATMQREINSRIQALNIQNHSDEFQRNKQDLLTMKMDLEKANLAIGSLEKELESQKEFTKQVLDQNGAIGEISSVVSEMARYRGEAARIEVEYVAGRRHVEILTRDLKETTMKLSDANTRIRELEDQLQEVSLQEAAARKECFETNSLYSNGGLTKDAADKLVAELEKLANEHEELKIQCTRYKERCDIALNQAQILENLKQDHLEEISELREHCSRLESRGDDDILIGKLQLQLMSTKTSYKAFVRKYQYLQNNMMQREISIRSLEGKLDEREETVLKIQSSYHSDLNALKKALRIVANTVTGQVGEVEELMSTNLDEVNRLKPSVDVKGITNVRNKIAYLSQAVHKLSSLTSSSISKTSELESELESIRGRLEDVIAENKILETKSKDLQSLIENPTTSQGRIASRISSLTEELKESKLVGLKQKRQIQVLKQEKKHLQTIISTMEADVENLEEINANAEVNNQQAASLFDPLLHGNSATDSLNPITSKFTSHRPITIYDRNDDYDSHDILVKNVEILSEELQEARKVNSTNVINCEKFQSRIAHLESNIKEYENQIAYYEKTMQSHGLPLLTGKIKLEKYHSDVDGVSLEEHQRLQEAAAATIDSLRSLLDDKNRLLESYRQRFEDLQFLDGKPIKKSRATANADALIDSINHDERNPTLQGQFRTDKELERMNEQMKEQIQQLDVIVLEKSQIIMQLEQKLFTQINQRERAEIRCGECIKEMESMKVDMVKLARQVQFYSGDKKSELNEASDVHEEMKLEVSKETIDSSHRQDLPYPPSDFEKKLNQYSKLIRTKDDKLREYRNIISSLKEEFIKLEQEKVNHLPFQASEINSSSITSEDAKRLKTQVTALRSEFNQAKEDLEKVRNAKEKLNKALTIAKEDNSKLESKVNSLQSQLALVEEMKEKFKKDLELSKRKEVRLREKLKESASDPNNTKDLLLHIENLEKELVELRHQGVGSNSNKDNSFTVATSAGRVLGGGDATNNDKDKDDVHQKLRDKWENEKRMQKRISVLDKRLQEKVEENEALHGQLKHARETAQAALQSKERKTGLKNSDRDQKLDTEDLILLDKANARIFQLENQISQLTRRIDVEMTSEIKSLQAQLLSSKQQIYDLENDLQTKTNLLRKAEMGGPRSIRDSEDRFMREEKLRDELVILKKHKLELESALVDRDTKIAEFKFDLEMNDQEVVRLKRRIKELEILNDSILRNNHGSEIDKGSSVKVKRERELEATVETMKKIIEKKELEIERLKSTLGLNTNTDKHFDESTPNKRVHGDVIDKRAVAEKKRADKLEEELKVAQTKLKGFADVNLKLLQKQQLVTSLQQQLKSKESEVSKYKQRIQSLENDVEVLTLRSKQSESTRPLSALRSSNPTRISIDKFEHQSQLEEMEQLRSQLDEVSRRLMEQEERRDIGNFKGNDALEEEISRLKEENHKLKTELSAFDGEYFDEIENLKWEHSVAIKKLRQYKRAYGDIA